MTIDEKIEMLKEDIKISQECIERFEEEYNDEDAPYRYSAYTEKEWDDMHLIPIKNNKEMIKEAEQEIEWLTELQILRIITEYLRDSIGVFDTVDGKVGIETDIIEWAKEELTVKGVNADEKEEN